MADLAPQLLAALKGDKGLYPDGVFTLVKSYRKDSIVKWDGSQWRALQLVPPGTTPVAGAYWERWIDGTPVADAAQVAADRVLSQAAAATVTALGASVSASALQVAGNLTAAQIAAQSALAVSGLANLSGTLRAILLDANTIAVHAYDTSRDEDRGAWVRKLMTSMVNEPLNTATRGAQSAAATMIFIVLTTTGLSLFSGDDPSGPFWSKFVDGGLGATSNAFYGGALSLGTSVAALHGVITVATTNGFWVIDVIGDTANRFHISASASSGQYLGNLADRNAGKGMEALSASYLGGPRVNIVNGGVNHAALKVLPHTPPNRNRFGLSNPTVFLATETGMSVIRHDGTVVNSNSGGAFKRVTVADDLTVYVRFGAQDATMTVYPYPNYLSAGFLALANLNSVSVPATMHNLARVGNNGALTALDNGKLAFAANTSGGVTLFNRDGGSINKSGVVYIDDYRNTGWMMGSVKVAFAESTKVLAVLTGATMFFDYFSDNDASDWTAIGGATISGAGGEMAITAGGSATYNSANKTVSGLTVGQSYSLNFNMKTDGVHSARFSVFDGVTTSLGLATATTNSTSYVAGRATFVAVSNSVVLRPMVDSPTPTIGAKATFKDIVVREVVGDRSAGTISTAGNYADLSGIVTRAAVAPGAELACYSNLNATNGSLFVINTGGVLNVGTGDFCVPVWFLRTNPAASESIMHFTDQVGGPSDGRGTNANWNLYIPNTGQITCATRDQTGAIAGGSTTDILGVGAWSFLVMQRRGTRLECYINGRLVGFWTVSGNLTNSAANLLIGAMFYNGVVGYRPQGSIALPRLSVGSALSADQIAAMYRDELEMFQPNAKCLLQGGYVVQDLSFDRDTNLLYVAKSAGGTDAFQGLVNKSTILSTASANVFPGAGMANVMTLLTGTTLGAEVAGPTGWGRGRAIAVIEDASTGDHTVRSASPNVPAAAHVYGAPVKKGSRGWGRLYIGGYSMFVDLTTGAIGTVAGGATSFPSVDLGNGFWLVQFGFTGVGAGMSAYVYAATGNNASSYAGNNGVGGAAIFVGDPIIRAGSTALTANDFVFGTSRSDNHKSVSAADVQVVLGTGAGADIVMPALPLRSSLRGRRAAVSYDPDVSKFSGRVTVDATPTLIGDPVFVPEGGKIDFVISVSAATPGGVATELVTTLLKGRAKRDIGDAAATVFVSAVQGSPTLPDKTTGTMDVTLVSMGGGWVAVRVTGKANTLVEWFGRQSLVRAAA